ncbi:hypothetical protein KJ785_00175 [Patescibacteria group bacterium]|nr:hypothetical protein [Patescibacteria group bacterium]
MPIGPLKNLPTLPSSGSTKPGRAQSFHPTSLGRDSTKKPTTSMSRAMGDSTKVSTSVSHPGGAGLDATTSISRPAVVVESLGREQMSEEERDDLRYNYVRRLVKARLAKEHEKSVQKAEKQVGDVYSKSVEKVGFSTGKTARMSGTQGMKMKLHRMIKENPSTYKNLSSKDRDYILGLIDYHASKLPTGGSFGRSIRKSIKKQIRKDVGKGDISRYDAKDFKNIIDQLPH